MPNTTIVIDIDESEFDNAKAIRSLIKDGYQVSGLVKNNLLYAKLNTIKKCM
jgi:hypothetical protein